MSSSFLSTIQRPTLLLDRSRVIRNIERMTRKAERAGVAFRPHFKTHQSAEIGEWFRDHGVRSIAVSSISMGRYFASHGWNDITVATPVNLRELDAIDTLSQQVLAEGGPPLAILVDSASAVQSLQQNVSSNLHVWIKVDVGYGRVGIPWDLHQDVNEVLDQIDRSRSLSFEGLLTHSGHTYQAGSVDEIREIHVESVERLRSARSLLQKSRDGRCALSIGDTPGCSVVDSFDGVDEIRPGNFVFYDLMQRELGSCRDEEIAVAIACPVVGKHQWAGKISIHCGAVHLSKESIHDIDGKRIYGCLMTGGDSSIGRLDRGAVLTSISQEHGIVRADEARLRQTELGDLVLVAPVHSCLAANLHREYRTLEGETISRF